uniref:Uncharacterized protein n=1 Tax=Anguilla anguilla TaxID=7936 RepID=A0A0E9VY25_ANGAN
MRLEVFDLVVLVVSIPPPFGTGMKGAFALLLSFDKGNAQMSSS